jgi:hypothetical protein
MKKNLLFFTLLFLTHIGYAQFISDPGTNKPIYSGQPDIQGSPFANTKWSNGVIITEKGISYDNLLFKYDAYLHELVFQINDSTYRFTEPVKEFMIHKIDGKTASISRFVKSSSIHNLLPGLYVQQLVNDKVSFYKHYKKIITETTNYGAAAGKQFEDKISYYIIVNNQLRLVVLSKKSLKDLLDDKWAEIDQYMEKNKLSPKSESAWAMVIEYYNGLK